MVVAAEAVLTETRETVEALTVSPLQQAHAMSHRAETTAESFCQAHTDMTTKEQARKKQLDLLESMRVYKEVYVDDLPAGTHVMFGRWVDTMKTPTVRRSKYTAGVYKEPHSDEGCFAAKEQLRASVCSWLHVSTNVVPPSPRPSPSLPSSHTHAPLPPSLLLPLPHSTHHHPHHLFGRISCVFYVKVELGFWSRFSALLSGVRPRSAETCAQMMLQSFLSRSHWEFGRFSTSPEYLTGLYAVQVLPEELVSRH